MKGSITMEKIAIVYFSQTGNTETMAQLIEEGIKSVGKEVEVFTISDFTTDMVEDYDLIAIGSPATGTEQLDEYEFEPWYTDIKDKLTAKPVVLFGSHDWGDGEWMRTWHQDAVDAGINVVLDPLVVNLQPMDDEADRTRDYGVKIANL